MSKLSWISILIVGLLLTVNVQGQVLLIETDPKAQEGLSLSLTRAVTQVKISGQYTTNIPDDSDLIIEFKDQKVILLNGCNMNTAQFQAYDNGSISFGPFLSTRKFCNPDFDNKYTSALSSSVQFQIEQKSNILRLKNSAGQNTIVLTPYAIKSQTQPKAVTFDNTYETNFNASDILIKFTSDNRVSLLNGCNVNSATYEAFDNGTIRFGMFMQTLRFCMDDQDSLYTNALSSSVAYQLDGDTLVLLTKNDQQSLVLTPINNAEQQSNTPITDGEQQSNTPITDEKQQEQQPSSTPTPIISQHQPLYYIDTSLKIFQTFTIIGQNDQHLGEIKQLLLSKYYHFTKDFVYLAALNKYRPDSTVIDYQLIIKSIMGTFRIVAEYTSTQHINIKTFTLFSVESSPASYQGCLKLDLINRNCVTCQQGYQNYKGRCSPIDANCAHYVADQCIACKPSTSLLHYQCK